jgi:hypothetical protein
MTIMSQLKSQWAADANTSTARNTYKTWVTRHPELNVCASPAELTDHIYTAPPTQANLLIGILLTEANAGDLLARRACLHAVRPLIGAMVSRIGGPDGRINDDLVSEMLTESLDIIDTLARQYGPDMDWPITVFVSRLFNRARRARTRRNTYDNSINHNDLNDTTNEPVVPQTRDAGTELINFLYAAVQQAAITPDEARLVASRAILDEAVKTNTVTDIGVRAAQKRHHKVVARLHESAESITDSMVA